MGVIRIELDVDSEIYPELHAALAGLRNARGRGERLRQLASAGLVWENVRIHGAAAIGPNPERPPPAPAPTRRDARPAPRPRVDTPRVDTPPPVRVPARNADFIDLAIDAEPAPVPLRRLPVLMDVVDGTGPESALPDGPLPAWAVSDAVPADGGVPAWSNTEPVPESTDEPLPAWAVSDTPPAVDLPPPAPEPEPEPVSPMLVDAAVAMPAVEHVEGDPLHLTALSHKPATRSRLMRMKERGLFKNG